MHNFFPLLFFLIFVLFLQDFETLSISIWFFLKIYKLLINFFFLKLIFSKSILINISTCIHLSLKYIIVTNTYLNILFLQILFTWVGWCIFLLWVTGDRFQYLNEKKIKLYKLDHVCTHMGILTPRTDKGFQMHLLYHYLLYKRPPYQVCPAKDVKKKAIIL